MSPSAATAARHCRICEPSLPVPPNPIFKVEPGVRILLISQAPGRLAHESGIPYLDPSGERLRNWLGVDKTVFYDTPYFGILPMGFCYPGKAKTGDLPPRPECAPQWHDALLRMMPDVQLRLYIGQYAQRYYLGKSKKRNLTETVRAYKEYLPQAWPIPHPSPLNNRWLSQNGWFEAEVIPVLQERVQQLIF